MKRFANFRLTAIMILVAEIFWLSACGGLAPQNQSANLPQNQNTNIAIVVKNSPTPTPSPIVVFENTPVDVTPPEIANVSPNTNLSNTNDLSSSDKLIIPVVGIKREDLRDTFKDARSQGRVHDAIDIMAPQGTPVVAVADGEIAKFFDSVRGGITVYQLSRDKKLVYYYAHLQRRADNLQEHQFVKQGTLIGYVGDTGNAGPGNNHLHFAIWTVTDPKHYWDGTNLNPYPLLHQ